MQPLVLPAFLPPSKVFPSLVTRIARHGRCYARGSSFCLPSTHVALTLRRRDCTNWKVPQILSRLRSSLPQSLSRRTLPPLIPTLKRHSHRLPLCQLPFPNPSPPLGERLLDLASQRTSLRRQSLSPCPRSTFLPQAKMASPPLSVRL